APPGFTPFR
uniref:[Ala1,Thr6]-bradykinin n=1 Tax=Physalaemus signifer TaxID=364768 RepID=BRK2_PHYSG|nr:RecName: Full=[Ala1,Thr6]-bradykinin [Physalaemus signifer]AAB32044.1 [Ala1,Thr6]bradykinin [Python reticulatus=reticulated pythons, plasma, Peptide, 9 aa] [Malayopython reticulatus]